MYDSPELVVLSTFGELSAGLTEAFPIAINITALNAGRVSRAIHYLHPSISGGIRPSALSAIFSTTQLRIERARTVVSMILLGGRIVLAIEQLTDIVEPVYSKQYIGLLCSMNYGYNLFSSGATLCSDYNAQLDTGFISDISDTNLIANPLLQDVQHITQFPYTSQTADAPMIVFAMRPKTLVSWAVSAPLDASSVAGSKTITSKRIEEFDMSLIDSTITNCSRISFVSTTKLLAATCDRVIVYFSVHPISFKLTFVSRHITSTSTGRVVSLTTNSHIMALSNNLASMTIFQAFTTSAPVVPSNDLDLTGSPASSGAKVSDVEAGGIAAGAAVVVILLVVVLWFSVCKTKRPSMAGSAPGTELAPLTMDGSNDSSKPIEDDKSADEIIAEQQAAKKQVSRGNSMRTQAPTRGNSASFTRGGNSNGKYPSRPSQ